MTEHEKTDFIGFEYKELSIKRNMESVYTDHYINFGWALESAAAPEHGGVGSVRLKFKRDRKIPNKGELSRLQRQFDACAAEIVSLERSKVVGASVVAYVLGIVGTAFMAGSVFAYIGGILPLSIALAVPGFIGWIVPYLCYRAVSRKQTVKVEPLIDCKYDELYDTCERAAALLKAC